MLARNFEETHNAAVAGLIIEGHDYEWEDIVKSLEDVLATCAAGCA